MYKHSHGVWTKDTDPEGDTEGQDLPFLHSFCYVPLTMLRVL